MLTNKQLQKTLDELEWLKKYYNKHYAVEKKPFTGEYDKKLRTELRAVVERINEDIDKVAEPIIIINGKPGRPPKDRILLTKLHLFQVLFEFTNREMECFSLMFILRGGESFSYKTIERAYSDPVVAMILHNLFVMSAGKPRKVDSSADGTGISLFISKHYRKDREQDLKEEKDTSKRREYLYSVAILDLDMNVYIGYAAGLMSEKELFIEALQMAKDAGFEIESMRLDKYYSYQRIFDCFDEQTRIVVIPKKNATIRGPKKWKEMLKRFTHETLMFLREYYRRTRSESNFSKDKRKHGVIRQRLPRRRITAAFSRAILHNFSMWHLYG
jgi:transposase